MILMQMGGGLKTMDTKMQDPILADQVAQHEIAGQNDIAFTALILQCSVQFKKQRKKTSQNSKLSDI